jgi:hypothetical protein
LDDEIKIKLDTDAARRREMVVLYPSVAVNLNKGITNTIMYDSNNSTHVGKKLTKLRPSNWEQVIKAKIGTLGSLSAIFKPAKALS